MKKDINNKWYNLFAFEKHQSLQLPPTQDELYQNIETANYQAITLAKLT